MLCQGKGGVSDEPEKRKWIGQRKRRLPKRNVTHKRKEKVLPGPRSWTQNRPQLRDRLDVIEHISGGEGGCSGWQRPCWSPDLRKRRGHENSRDNLEHRQGQGLRSSLTFPALRRTALLSEKGIPKKPKVRSCDNPDPGHRPWTRRRGS